MTVISVLNQKGGVGKTTISTHLARAFQISGKTVILVDSDVQGSARDWSAAHQSQPLSVVAIDRPTIERDLKSLARTDWVVIDGAPQAREMAVSALKASDFVLIPCQPSPYDIWAASDLVDLVRQRIEITDGRLRAAFVISRAIANTKLGADVTDALAGYGLPILTTRIHQRVSYPTSAATGQTAFDLAPENDAAREFMSLKNEIEQLLK